MSITIKTPSGPIETTLRELVVAISSEASSQAEADAVLMNMIDEGRLVFGGLSVPRSRQVGAALGA